MSNFKKYGASMSAIIVSSLLLTATANAQDQDEDRNVIDVLTDTVVVTGTKKADGENQQDAKVAITALGAEQLEALQFRNLSDLAFKAPNVQLDEIGTVKGVASFSIRGLGVSVVFDTFDVDSVEILRGPQGVLFGRNVTGGAVVLNSGNPTDEFTFKVKGAAESGLIGTGGNYTAQGVVSGPLGESGFKAKIGGYYNNDRGFHENLFDWAERNSYSSRCT